MVEMKVIPFRSEGHPIEILLTQSFEKGAIRVFTDAEIEGLLNFLSAHPDSGKVIPGTGGLRKIRWPAKGQGKRGGGRIIYYFRDLNMPLLVLAVYSKNEKADLTASEYRIISEKVREAVGRTGSRALFRKYAG